MTREQERASRAHRDVTAVKEGTARCDADRYATVVYQLITLVRTAGTVQAMEFVNGLTSGPKKEAGQILLNHLAGHLGRVSEDISDGSTLRSYARETADLSRYMVLTRELLAALVWYRRFVQSELGIDPARADRDDD